MEAVVNMHDWPTCSRSGCTEIQRIRYADAPKGVGWCENHDPRKDVGREYAIVYRTRRRKLVLEWAETEGVTECVYCGKILTTESMTRDHIIPLSRGGLNVQSNIAPACSSCNSEKGPLTASEYLAAKADGTVARKRREVERLFRQRTHKKGA